MKHILYLFSFILLFTGIQPASGQVIGDGNDDEWIKVYFNMPADTTLMTPGNKSNHSWDIIGTLVELIDSAKATVDLAIYDLENMRVGNALVAAKNRGVDIRIVTDNFNRTNGGEQDKIMLNALAEAGIYSIDDDGDVYNPDGTIDDNTLVNSGADMHHKFAVIDYHPDSAGSAYVWAGSTNLTYTGAFNTNNTIVVKHDGIAKVFTDEFEQMWGGSGLVPNPKKAKFHKDKKNVSQNIFNVGGTPVELYFSPMDRAKSKPSISNRIVEVINKETDHDIRFLSFAITPTIDISQAMWNKSGDHVTKLEGVIDRGFYSRYRNAGDIWGTSEAISGSRLILPSNEIRKLHHKFILIDAENPDTTDVAVVITGSYNFSNNAELSNDENLFIIYSNKIANQFYQDFGGVQSRAMGVTEPPAPPFDHEAWHEVTSIRDGSTFEIEIAPRFPYPVKLLGVSVPGTYAGPDSSFYYADEAEEFLRDFLTGRKVKIADYDGGYPYMEKQSFYGYVKVQTEFGEVSLNKLMLEEGLGTVNNNFKQHPDSSAAFRSYSNQARAGNKGLWANQDKIWTKVPSKESENILAIEFPININTANQDLLVHLPGIGPTYAQRIIEYREENNGFKNIQELLNIKGIGAKRFETIEALVTVGGE